MSYDLGYEFGYESDWEKVPVKDARQAKSSDSPAYSMSPPSGVRPGSPEWIRFYTDLAGTMAPPPGTGGPGGTGGTAGTGGPSGAGGTGAANPNPPPGTGDPAAAGGLAGMGGTPVAPGSLPSGAPEGTPTLSHTELATAHSGAEWEGVRTELRDHYGFTPAEVDAFENQYNGRSPADLRTGEPPILPAHPDDTTPMTGLTGDTARRPRIEAGNAIRRRVSDDAVHELGGRVHGMFAEGEISRDTADAMAAQMYRRNGFDPDANPPNIGDLSAARARPEGGGPSRIDREMATLRGPSFRTPAHGDPSAGLHRSDPTVAPLMSETESVYRARAAENLGAAFGGVPGRGPYYNGSTAGLNHRREDAQAFFTHRGIDHDAGALRGIARTTTPARTPGGPVPPHPMQAEVTTFVSAYRNPGNNSLTPMGNGISTRMAADPSRPLDTTGWTPAARQQHDSAMAMRRYDTEARREEARTSHLNAIELANHNAGLTEDAAKRNFGRDMTRMGAQHELSMAQQHDQQLNQLMQNMANHGMQSMAQDKQAMQNLTLEQLRSINQITSQLLQAGSPRPFDIVAQMLGGGGGGRR